MIARLAWRNTFRHTRRTAITALAIALAITFLIVFDTIYGGMKAQSLRLVLDYENSELVLLPKGNFDDYRLNPLDSLLENASYLMSELRGSHDISDATPRLRFNAMLNVAGEELIAVGVGVDPRMDKQVFKLDERTDEGSFLASDEELIIGSGLAADLGVGLGDPVMVSTKTRRGIWELREYVISGIVTTGNMFINRNTFFLTLAEAQDLLEARDAVSEINMHVAGNPKDIDNLENLASKIERNLAGNDEVFTWLDMNAGYFDAFDAEQSVAYVIALIIIAIALVGIVNTMLLSIYERVPELGTMRAMGFTGSQIHYLLMTEGAIIGLFASLAGVLLGTLVSFPLVRYGMDFTGLTENYDFQWPVDMHVYGRFSAVNISITFLFSWVVSILASIIPARKATRIEPSQALRSV